jgi:hypothetical protein
MKKMRELTPPTSEALAGAGGPDWIDARLTLMNPL